jgi:hypothetical protein
MQEAGAVIDSCGLFDDMHASCQENNKILISSRYRKAGIDDAYQEWITSRICWILKSGGTCPMIHLMREANLLADSRIFRFHTRADSQNNHPHP